MLRFNPIGLFVYIKFLIYLIYYAVQRKYEFIIFKLITEDMFKIVDKNKS